MDIPYIPYFTTSRYRVQAMIELAKVQPREKVADLGTGDGRIAIAFAKAGAVVIAYELDDDKIQLARENIEKAFSSVVPDSDPGSNSSLSKAPYRLLVQGKVEGLDSRLRGNDNVSGNDIIKPVILKKDFWYEDLSQYSVICCYPMPTIMGRLEHKLMKELKPGSRVLLNYFPFLHWKEKARKDNVFLYER